VLSHPTAVTWDGALGELSGEELHARIHALAVHIATKACDAVRSEPIEHLDHGGVLGHFQAACEERDRRIARLMGGAATGS
jgi:hypothetical protein